MAAEQQLLKCAKVSPSNTTIPPGCCSQDYIGDNPEVKGSVPGAGPPKLQAGSHGDHTVTTQETVVYFMSSLSG